jgi:hypothetical protein
MVIPAVLPRHLDRPANCGLEIFVGDAHWVTRKLLHFNPQLLDRFICRSVMLLSETRLNINKECSGVCKYLN